MEEPKINCFYEDSKNRRYLLKKIDKDGYTLQELFGNHNLVYTTEIEFYNLYSKVDVLECLNSKRIVRQNYLFYSTKIILIVILLFISVYLGKYTYSLYKTYFTEVKSHHKFKTYFDNYNNTSIINISFDNQNYIVYAGNGIVLLPIDRTEIITNSEESSVNYDINYNNDILKAKINIKEQSFTLFTLPTQRMENENIKKN